VTSTSARLSALAAFRPPNPLPMMTTRCRDIPLIVYRRTGHCQKVVTGAD
jgi:hypothetical protein